MDTTGARRFYGHDESSIRAAADLVYETGRAAGEEDGGPVREDCLNDFFLIELFDAPAGALFDASRLISSLDGPDAVIALFSAGYRAGVSHGAVEHLLSRLFDHDSTR